jgi:hypothetical protein
MSSSLTMCQQMADIQQEGYNQGLVDGKIAVDLTQKETDITEHWNKQMNDAYNQWYSDSHAAHPNQDTVDADYKAYQEDQQELQTQVQVQDAETKPSTGQATLDQTYEQNWSTVGGILASVGNYLAQELQSKS